MTYSRFYSFTVALLFLATQPCVAKEIGNAAASTLTLGQSLPRYSLSTLETKPISTSDLQYPVLISVFTTWCGVCRVELGDLNKAYIAAQKAGKPLSILAIDSGEEESKVSKYVQKKGLSFPVYVDKNLSFTEGLGIEATPTILIFDKDKKLIFEGHKLPQNWQKLVAL